MKNYISKILITLGIVALFLVGVNNASANNDCTVSWTTPVNCTSSGVYSPYNYQYSTYNNQHYQYPYYNNPNQRYYNNRPSTSTTPVVNNYYYRIDSTPISRPTSGFTSTKNVQKSSTVTKKETANKVTSASNKTTASPKTNSLTKGTKSDQVYNSGLAALSLHSSNSFIPSTFWQWLITIILILVIAILSRLVSKLHHKKDRNTPIH